MLPFGKVALKSVIVQLTKAHVDILYDMRAIGDVRCYCSYVDCYSSFGYMWFCQVVHVNIAS